jgi:hypothetical protein
LRPARAGTGNPAGFSGSSSSLWYAIPGQQGGSVVGGRLFVVDEPWSVAVDDGSAAMHATFLADAVVA